MAVFDTVTPAEGATGVNPRAWVEYTGHAAVGQTMIPIPTGPLVGGGFGVRIRAIDGGVERSIVDEGVITADGIAQGWEYDYDLAPGTGSASILRCRVRKIGGFTPSSDYANGAGAGGLTGSYIVSLRCYDTTLAFPVPMAYDGPLFSTGTSDVYAEGSVSADEIARYAADLPMLVAPNATEKQNAPAEWRAGGVWSSGVDETYDSGVIAWATSRACDRWPDVPTRPETAETTTHLLFDLAKVSFNVIGIFGHNFLACGATEVAIEIANDGDFGTDMIALATWTSDFGQRLIAVDLNDLKTYANVRWLRVRIESAGIIPPAIGELFLGTRYALPHRWDDEADDRSLESKYGVAETERGDQQRLRRWGGRLATALTWHPNTAAYLALFRDWFAATRWGADPFLWIPAPLSLPFETYYCRTAPAGAVVNDEFEINTRTVPLIEQAPFVSKDLVA